ncbi:hypothetical protein DLE01_25995, partial [Streptomyces sp. FT05W]
MAGRPATGPQGLARHRGLAQIPRRGPGGRRPACLDHIFSLQITSCLVNPRACHETELVLAPTRLRKRGA